MTYYVLAFPSLSAVDKQCIQNIRQAYDPQFKLLDPHVTLVFGLPDADETALITHVQTAVHHHAPIHLTLRCATVVQDAFSKQYHTFLVPDEGHSQLVKLHDALYTGLLTPELRLDIPYIPHITIATFSEASQSKNLADSLNQQNLQITSHITTLSILKFNHLKRQTIMEIPLHE